MSAGDFRGVLVGLQIERVKFIHDYLQLVLTEGVTLTVYNTRRLLGGSAEDFLAKPIVNVICDEHRFTMQVGMKLEIHVGLKDEDFFTPEAMVLHASDDAFIVWQ